MSSGTSTCFFVSPPRRTLSELAMISTPTPDEICVQIARIEEDRLAGLEVDEVEQERAHDPDVAGVERIESASPGVLACECRAGRTRGARPDRRSHEVRAVTGRHRHERRKTTASPSAPGEARSGARTGSSSVTGELVEETERVARSTKAAERVARERARRAARACARRPCSCAWPRRAGCRAGPPPRSRAWPGPRRDEPGARAVVPPRAPSGGRGGEDRRRRAPRRRAHVSARR